MVRWMEQPMTPLQLTHTEFPAAVFFMIAALTVVMKHKYKYKMQIQNAKTKYKDQ